MAEAGGESAGERGNLPSGPGAAGDGMVRLGGGVIAAASGGQRSGVSAISDGNRGNAIRIGVWGGVCGVADPAGCWVVAGVWGVVYVQLWAGGAGPGGGVDDHGRGRPARVVVCVGGGVVVAVAIRQGVGGRAGVVGAAGCLTTPTANWEST